MICNFFCIKMRNYAKNFEDVTTMKKSNTIMWLQAAVTLFLVALTYPLFEPDYGTGLDSSYVWGLNYLFDSDYTTLTHLIYPYGPMALLKLPTPYNGHFAIFLIFYTLVKANGPHYPIMGKTE